MGFFDTLLLTALFSAAAFVLALLIGRIGVANVEGRPEMKAAETVLPRRAQLESRLELRASDVKQEIARMSAEVSNLRRRRFTLEKELMDARREAESPVRVVGREGTTPVHYRAWMINRQVQAVVAESKQHQTLDSDWATPQVVEVWADNLNDARKELQRIYPPPLGFTILNIRLETGEETPEEAE